MFVNNTLLLGDPINVLVSNCINSLSFGSPSDNQFVQLDTRAEKLSEDLSISQ